MKINMRDVARRAGVSAATVSHVINRTRFVSDATREKVLDAIRELDYSPDLMARIFKTGKKNLIGFIVPDIANRFFATVIEEVEDVIARHQFKLIVANTKETGQRETDNIRLLASGIVDGLIVASTLKDFSEVEKNAPEGFPMVFIDRALPHCPCDFVTISDFDPIYQSTESLLLGGHKKIGYIAGLSRLSTTAERLGAYRRALADHGVPEDPALVQYADSMARSARVCAEKLVRQNCTAIIASNNVMTLDTLIYLNERNIRPGRDIAVVGYCEDERETGLFPGVDYIRQPVAELGRTAGARIVDRIRNPQVNPRNTVLSSTLMKRE